MEKKGKKMITMATPNIEEMISLDEVDGLESDVQGHLDTIEHANEQLIAVEDFLTSVLDVSRADGLSTTSAMVAQYTLEMFATNLGMDYEKYITLPSLETYDTYLGRHASTEAFVDSLKNFLDKIKEAIRIMYDRALKFFSDIVVKLFSSSAKVKAKAKKLIEIAQKIDKNTPPSEKEVTGVFIRFALISSKGRLTSDKSINMLHDEAKKMLNVLSTDAQNSPLHDADKIIANIDSLVAVAALAAPVRDSVLDAAGLKDVRAKLDTLMESIINGGHSKYMGKQLTQDKIKKYNLINETYSVGGKNYNAVNYFSDETELPGGFIVVNRQIDVAEFETAATWLDAAGDREDAKGHNSAVAVANVVGTVVKNGFILNKQAFKYNNLKTQIVDLNLKNHGEGETQFALSPSEVIRDCEAILKLVDDLEKFNDMLKKLNTSRTKINKILETSMTVKEFEGTLASATYEVAKYSYMVKSQMAEAIASMDKPAVTFLKYSIRTCTHLLDYCEKSLTTYDHPENATK